MYRDNQMSIDTIQINSYIKVLEINPAIHDEPRFNTKTSRFSYIFNINNLNENAEQITDYCTYKNIKERTLEMLELTDANTVRIDFAYDSFTPNYYQDMFVITKFLMMLIANKYSCNNIYECVNQWTFDKNSIALKSQRFDIENYNKQAQENKSENEEYITDRLEFRIKKMYDEPEENKELIAFDKLKHILNKAIEPENIHNLESKITNLLIEKIAEHKTENTIDETLTVYKDSIFTKKILVDVLAAVGYTDAKQKASRFIKKKNLTIYKYKNINDFVAELIEKGAEFFNQN